MAIDGRIEIQNQKVVDAVRRVLLSLPIGGDAKPMFTILGRVVKTDTQLRFREQKTPDGSSWQPSQRVLREGGQTLSLTHRLRNSITYQADHASVVIGTNVIYAAIQHHGGEAGRVGKDGGRAKIPSREFLGLSDRGGDEAVTSVGDFLARQWR